MYTLTIYKNHYIVTNIINNLRYGFDSSYNFIGFRSFGLTMKNKGIYDCRIEKEKDTWFINNPILSIVNTSIEKELFSKIDTEKGMDSKFFKLYIGKEKKWDLYYQFHVKNLKKYISYVSYNSNGIHILDINIPSETYFTFQTRKISLTSINNLIYLTESIMSIEIKIPSYKFSIDDDIKKAHQRLFVKPKFPQAFMDIKIVT